MNRILIEPAAVADGGRVVLAGRRARHVIGVLRAAVGDELRVGLVDGPRGRGRVLGLGQGTVELECAFEAAAPARPRVDLLLALPRPKVLGRLWAPLASLGLGRVALTNAWRVERNYFDSHQVSERGWRPRLIAGLEQAGDTRLPAVSVHKRLVVLVEDELERLFGRGRRLLADPGRGQRVGRALRPAPAAGERVLLAVGPEGGWIDRERELLQRVGFQTVQAGPRVLSTEVACCVLLGLVHEALAL